jgi:hypothetical protein
LSVAPLVNGPMSWSESALIRVNETTENGVDVGVGVGVGVGLPVAVGVAVGVGVGVAVGVAVALAVGVGVGGGVPAGATETVSTSWSAFELPRPTLVNFSVVTLLSAVKMKWKGWKVTEFGSVVPATGGVIV